MKFLNYPEAKAGPDIPYKKETKSNPAVRGIYLPISAFLLETFGFVRAIIWRNTGFSNLRNIREHIEDYEPRFDPTVVPLPSEGDQEDVVEEDATHVEPSAKSQYYSVAAYHELYLSGELTPLAVVQAILPLIRRDLSPPGEHSTAWFDSNVELIWAAAEASTLRYKEKRHLGPLDGVPAGVKDDYDLDGYKTTLGSVNDYTTKVADGESITTWPLRKLQESGVIVLGKLSMHEFGLDTSGSNPNYGTPLNPYNSEYYTGGSSSGPAYAVATGLIPIALGSDGGGSIRIPSSFCSVYGLKPTHGRVSLWPGVNHSNTCAVDGPIAADITSLSTLYEIVGTPDPRSPFPIPRPLSRSPPSKSTRVLGIPEIWFAQATPAIQSLCRSLIDKLVSEHDYDLIPITIPFLPEGQLAHAMTVLTDAATLLPSTKNLTPANKVMIALGTVTPSTDYLLAQKLRQLLMQHLAHLWKQHPGMVIVTPTTSCAGWRINKASELTYGISDGDTTLLTMEYVWMANFCGLPSLAVPAGYIVPEKQARAGEVAAEDTLGKVPVGLMAMGEWASEEELLRWGRLAEGVAEERRCRPPNWVDVVERAREWMKSDDLAAA